LATSDEKPDKDPKEFPKTFWENELWWLPKPNPDPDPELYPPREWKADSSPPHKEEGDKWCPGIVVDVACLSIFNAL
jgi:hypothetical protein